MLEIKTWNVRRHDSIQANDPCGPLVPQHAGIEWFAFPGLTVTPTNSTFQRGIPCATKVQIRNISTFGVQIPPQSSDN
jgi:hypothetical protein